MNDEIWTSTKATIKEAHAIADKRTNDTKIGTPEFLCMVNIAG